MVKFFASKLNILIITLILFASSSVSAYPLLKAGDFHKEANRFLTEKGVKDLSGTLTAFQRLGRSQFMAEITGWHAVLRTLHAGLGHSEGYAPGEIVEFARFFHGRIIELAATRLGMNYYADGSRILAQILERLGRSEEAVSPLQIAVDLADHILPPSAEVILLAIEHGRALLGTLDGPMARRPSQAQIDLAFHRLTAFLQFPAGQLLVVRRPGLELLERFLRIMPMQATGAPAVRALLEATEVVEETGATGGAGGAGGAGGGDGESEVPLSAVENVWIFDSALSDLAAPANAFTETRGIRNFESMQRAFEEDRTARRLGEKADQWHSLIQCMLYLLGNGDLEGALGQDIPPPELQRLIAFYLDALISDGYLPASGTATGSISPAEAYLKFTLLLFDFFSIHEAEGQTYSFIRCAITVADGSPQVTDAVAGINLIFIYLNDERVDDRGGMLAHERQYRLQSIVASPYLLDESLRRHAQRLLTQATEPAEAEAETEGSPESDAIPSPSTRISPSSSPTIVTTRISRRSPPPAPRAQYGRTRPGAGGPQRRDGRQETYVSRHGATAADAAKSWR